MKKRRIRFRFVILILTLLLILIGGSIYLTTGSLTVPTFIQPNHSNLTFSSDTSFIPLSSGYIAMNDDVTRYDKKNQPVLMDDLPESLLSFDSLSVFNDYIILNNTSVYQVVDNQPALFVPIFTEPQKKLVDIVSLKDALLITNYDGVSSYSLSLFSDDNVTNINLPDDVFLLKAVSENQTNNFSALCYRDEGPFLGTTITNYENDEIVGEIVLHDVFYYDLLRFNHIIILVGTSDLACYNIESGLELWHYSFATPSSLVYTSSESGAMIASSNAIINNQSMLLVNSDGSPVQVSFNKPILLVDTTPTGYLFTTTDALMQVTREFSIKHVSPLSNEPATLHYNPYLNCAYIVSTSEEFSVSYVK